MNHILKSWKSSERICTWLNMHRRLHSASFQVNITFSLDQRGEDILKAVNVYHRTPRENWSNGKIMLLTSHQSLFGWLCDYEWVVGYVLTFFYLFDFFFFFLSVWVCFSLEWDVLEASWQGFRFPAALNHWRIHDWLWKICIKVEERKP